ncbi:transport ATP-binding protein cydD [Vibrio ishigakensis]|uniref:Transport ATP-binding protein cydD n=1 Tax=Vibrio ishigakensis TaxID=1481914 RepID=A0A0B8QA09_9VIBR|nr:transport ATP-binding protein cydD [Vibrio ishigakensis]
MPYQGSIKVNGVELSELNLEQYRDAISWVGQNPLLVHGTIEENLNLSEKPFSKEQISSAIIDAHADEFVDRLGLDYAISDRSGGLSVGQAQRIALARAILQQGKFWILDEPTASLDAQSEKLINQSLDKVLEAQTTLMVTHQLNNLQKMDQILVLERGQITQQGHFDELKEQGTFQTMLKHQNTEGGDLDA